MRQTAYTNGVIYTGTAVEKGKAILVKEGLVEGIIDGNNVPSGYQLEDLGGNNIAPSFIDLQIYGGKGELFSLALDVDSILGTYEYCLEGGASHFMITQATNSIDDFLKGIAAVNEYWRRGYKGLLGLHMEGPYLNPLKKGAHAERYIKIPERAEVEMLLSAAKGAIKMMTVAPEVCSYEIIQLLQKEGVIVSAGHTNATYDEAMLGLTWGIPAATHLFNAMSPLQGRNSGMVGAAFDHDTVAASIICDGVHVDFSSVRISKKIMKDRLFFITDAVTEARGGEYQHYFKGDRFTLANGTLSGSAITMMKNIQNAVNQVGISLEEAIRMCSLYPAKLLGEKAKLGSIAKGYKASFTVFNEELETIRVITG
ncbi:MAG: N-acetylglucosamine-6-phosphate deacetylase [Flavitalea sp.]